jgi:hypothetical protein
MVLVQVKYGPDDEFLFATNCQERVEALIEQLVNTSVILFTTISNKKVQVTIWNLRLCIEVACIEAETLPSSGQTTEAVAEARDTICPLQVCLFAS